MTGNRSDAATETEVPRSFLAWCYERWNKAEQKHVLKDMSSLASILQSMFVCKKKAHGFMKWWSGAGMPHGVIFTDWREAKPLVEGLSEVAADYGKPLDEILGESIHICVIAQSSKIYLRALEWGNIVMNNQVKVVPQFSMAELKGYAKDCLKQEAFLDSGGLTCASDTLSETSASSGSTSPRLLCNSEEKLPWLNWTDLMIALQDPWQAALLEKAIKESSAQIEVYED